MRISALPMVFASAVVAIAGICVPSAQAADLTITDNVCQISFTDSEKQFSDSKFREARVGLIEAIKDRVPSATDELNELQQVGDSFKAYEDIQEWEQESAKFGTIRALIDEIDAKAIAAGVPIVPENSQNLSEAGILLDYWFGILGFEKHLFHYWNILYNGETDRLQIPVSNAETALKFVDMFTNIEEPLKEELEGNREWLKNALTESLNPLRPMQAFLSPVLTACQNGQPGTSIELPVDGKPADNKPGDGKPGDDKPGDKPGDDKKPSTGGGGSSFGSS
ncbi:hypothetical protein [Corynebacterium crudilactis]|uniref:Uncharacterized protein n=1 Tax=Corynebacterium crudilactis TaxID=1652495 RepID=A0A172QWQ7_9CORY|nr:hypothetical protein [Corynebacterium crudilactis]ANE05145.1 hypothetical protein ccrud_13680 [Corynebacterium crudilactis]